MIGDSNQARQFLKILKKKQRRNDPIWTLKIQFVYAYHLGRCPRYDFECANKADRLFYGFHIVTINNSISMRLLFPLGTFMCKITEPRDAIIKSDYGETFGRELFSGAERPIHAYQQQGDRECCNAVLRSFAKRLHQKINFALNPPLPPPTLPPSPPPEKRARRDNEEDPPPPHREL